MRGHLHAVATSSIRSPAYTMLNLPCQRLESTAATAAATATSAEPGAARSAGRTAGRSRHHGRGLRRHATKAPREYAGTKSAELAAAVPLRFWR